MQSLIKDLLSVAKDRSFSQAELATAAGLHPVTLSRAISTGKCQLSTVEAIATYLGLRLVAVPDNSLAEGLLKGDLF